MAKPTGRGPWDEARHANRGPIAMIRRDEGDDWLLVAQVDHAHLAAEIARVWGNENVSPLPLPDLLVPAIRDHDDGWRDWEQSPEIDSQTGFPRDFTEMPMTAATQIWTESIDSSAHGTRSQAAALKRYREFLAVQNETFDGERAAVLESLAGLGESFRRDEAERLSATVQIGRKSFNSCFDELLQAGIVRLVGRDVVDDYYVAELPIKGSSPLGGLWVSQHFCYLAEKARESRNDNVHDATAIERFLNEQADRQRKWNDNSLRDFAGDELQRLIETGYRYVQFFDRISLWLCCAERTEAVEMTLLGGDTFRLIPRKTGHIAIEPYPLDVASLKLTVGNRRIPARRYDRDGLRQAIDVATIERLQWTLCR